MSTEIVVVGAGPTGLLLACELARHGVSVRVVERRAARSIHSKALAVHARTLELWEDVGVLGEALRRGRQIHGMNLYSGKKRLAHVSLDELESPFPYVLVLPQSETEAILEARATELGVAIERNVEVVALEQDANAVRLTLRRGERDEVVSTSYAVGCDGAHSVVREQLGLDYLGSDVEARFVFADANLTCELATDEGHTWFAPEGVVLMVPLPTEGRWRAIVSIPQQEGRAPKPTAEQIDSLLRARVGFDYTLSDTVWLAGFDVRQRKVKDYRVGRVLLAGDSAHCHSPIGGQGMNTGQQDAYNLGWRLALVARGAGREALLDAYTAEREPIADALLRGTARGTRVVTLRSPVTQAIRNQLATFLTGLDVVRQRLARQVGELSVHYRRSPLVGEDRASVLQAELRRDPESERPSLWDWGEFGSGPRPGERVPDTIFETPRGEQRLFDLLHGTAHVLLLFDGAAPTEAGYTALSELATAVRARCADAVRVHVVVPHASQPAALADESVLLDQAAQLHGAFRAGAECLYLIRPDGYVGYRAQPVVQAKLLAYLDTIFTSCS